MGSPANTGNADNTDHEDFNTQHRGGVFFEQLGIDLFPHAHLGFALAPGHRSETLNTDEEGFRLSASPHGPVDSVSWVADGGGGLLLGSSVAFGLGATSDSTTLASHLAALTGERWLNLAVLAANSTQELIAAIPYLHAAKTVVVFSGLGNYIGLLRARTWNAFGPIFYEGTFAKLTQVPLFDLAALSTGDADLAEVEANRREAPVPPEPDASQFRHRVEEAARIQLRDLAFVARTAPEGTRVVFCLQPLATPRTRELTPEEQERYDFQESLLGVPNEVVEQHFETFGDIIEKGCPDLGAEFLRIGAHEFVGPSFVSNGVLTDEGNRQAAQKVHAFLEKG